MRRYSRRFFLQSIGLFAAGTVGVSPRAMADDTPTITVAHPESFRILQCTDLHFFSRDKETWDKNNALVVENIRKMLAQTSADMFIATGDVWSEDQDGLGATHMRYAIDQFVSMGVPWAFTWGNHDKLSDDASGHAAFTQAPNSLYRGAGSEGNYAINIVNPAQERVWQLVCLNSRQKGLNAEQQQWVKTLTEQDKNPVPRIAFFHIPLKQYADVWENGAAIGMKGEKVCSEQEDGSTLAVLKSAGIRACFCGHDHQNDYGGVYDGVELVYGRCSRAGGYGADVFPKGAKLITINTVKKTYEWVSVMPDGTRWKPKPGERIEIPDV